MHITVISRDEKSLAGIAALLRNRNPAHQVETLAGALKRLPAASSPDVVIVDQPNCEAGDLDSLERLGNQHPRIAFILLCRRHTPDFLLQAMRAGVREVIDYPAPPGCLYQALERIEEKLQRRSDANGKLLAFISCKGGSGATFLATNLAYALAAQGDSRVALIDMNLQFGDASLFVSDQKPLATLADVAQQIHRLDPSFLASSMLNVLPNYGVLAAPDDPTLANDVKPEHVDAILRLARQQYDFIVLDIGRRLDAISIRALDQADMIFPVLQTTLPYIRDGKRLLDVFRSLDYPMEKVHLVVNRHDKGGEISVLDLVNAYGSDIYMTVPNHYEAAAASVNQGIPVLQLAPASPITRALQEFARRLSGAAPIAAQDGWLGRLLRRA